MVSPKIIYDDNILVVAAKGHNITEKNISKLNIQFPKNGFFIAVEWLIIDENKFEFESTYKNSKKKINVIKYQPSFGCVPLESNEAWYFINGNWRKGVKNHSQHLKAYKDKYSVIAVELSLTD